MQRNDITAEGEVLSDRLHLLVLAMQAVAAATTLDALMAAVRAAARGLMGADGATFVLREGEMSYYADEDAIAPLWKGQRFPLTDCISGWVILHGQAAVIRDIYADPRVPAAAYRPTFVKSLAMLPIGKTDAVGAIGIYWSSPHTPSADEVQLVQALAYAAAGAIDTLRVSAVLERHVAKRATERESAIQKLTAESERRIRERMRWREQSEMLNRMFDAMHICVVYLDLNFNFLRVNKAYADGCGHPPEYLIGKNHFALYPGRETEEIFRNVVKTGVPYAIEANPFQFPDHPEWGVTYWDWSVHPVCDEGGRIENILFVLLNVTERERAAKALRESQARLNNLVDIAVDAIVAVDEQECIQIFNKGAEAVFGYRAAEVLGQPLDLLLPSWALQVHHQHLRDFDRAPVAARLKGARHMVAGRRKDGSEFPAEGSISRQSTDGRTLFTVILRDVTERQHLEAELSNRVRQQAAIAELGRRALANVSGRTLYNEAAATVAATLDLEFCGVLQLLPGGGALKLVAGVGWCDGLTGRLVVGMGADAQAGATLASGATIVVEDWGAEARFDVPPLLTDHDILSGMSVIIGRPETPWGVMGAHSSRRRSFKKDDVNFLESVAHLLGVAIARSEAENASRDLALRLLCAEDAERRRIAKELHDSTAQDLVAAMLNLDSLRDSAFPRDSAEAKHVEDGLALLENCAHEIRTLAYVLHPPELDGVGLAGAVQTYAAGFGERTGIATRMELQGDSERLEEATELVLFRVVQECLGNIHRHASSPTASIRLQQEATVVELEIRDQGCGIPAEVLDGKPGVNRGLGVGIRGMRERLKQLGGRLIIDSGPGGTTVRAIVPRESDQA